MGTHNRDRARACAIPAHWPRRTSGPQIGVQEPSFDTVEEFNLSIIVGGVAARGEMEGILYDVLTVQEESVIST